MDIHRTRVLRGRRNATRRVILVVAILGACAAPASADFGALVQCQTSCNNFTVTCKDLCRAVHCRPILPGTFGCGFDAISCVRNCDLSSSQCLNGCISAAGDVGPIARVSENGRQIVIDGVVTCDPALLVQSFDVTVTQQATGALAKGEARAACTGVEQHLDVEAIVRGSEEFLVPGEAQVCAAGRFGANGRTISAKQWCAEVQIWPESVEFLP